MKPGLSPVREKAAVVISTFLFFLLFINATFPSNTLIVISFSPLFFLLIGRLGVSARKAFIVPIVAGGYLLFLWGLSFLLNSGSQNQAFLPETKRLVLAFTYHLTLIFLFSKNKSVLFKAITLTLWFLVGFWWVQALVYYSTGYYLDPLSLLGIREQKSAAYFARGAYLKFNLIRPTSFFNEPGTYGSNIILLLVLHYLIENKVKLIHILTLVSMVGSLSTFSIMAALVFVTILIVDKLRTGDAIKKIGWAFFGAFLSLCSIPLITQYIEMRTIKGVGFVGANLRDYIFEKWVSFPFARLFMGAGLFSCDIDLSKYKGFKTVFHGNTLHFLQDSSFAFYLLVTLGAWSLPLLLLFRTYCNTSKMFALFSIVLLLKISITNYALWATLACLLIISTANGFAPIKKVA